MASPKFSIIVPAYNAAQYIELCIDSILQQSSDDYELIIIDDGSMDETKQIIEQKGKNHAKIKLIHQANQGVSSARNKGIEAATGEWITFIDSDDTIETDFLKAADEIIRHQNTDFVLAPWVTEWVNTGKEDLHNYKYGTQIEGKEQVIAFWSKEAHSDICRCPWGKFFRKEILDNHSIRFNEKLRYAEDTLFCLQYVIKINSISLITNPETRYKFKTYTNTSAIKKYRSSAESIVIARDEIMQLFYDNNLSNLVFERLMFFSFTMIEHKYIRKKDDTIRKAFYNNPLQKRLERRCLKGIRFYDRMMYYMYKHLPHEFMNCLSVIYLKYR